MLTYFLIIIGITGGLITLKAVTVRVISRFKAGKEEGGFSTPYLSSQQLVIENILTRLNYFKQLSSKGKEKFIVRTQKILQRLVFSTAGNIVADDEKRALIIASIVQITFGLEDFDIDSIEHVKIFENNIYNPKTKAQYFGLTFMNGNMYLSWQPFLEGIKTQDDGINLGLHETGHGLYILLKQNSANEDFDDILTIWYADAQSEINHSGDGKNEFFRKYADANKEEFFAICIENFFERPLEFEKRLPEIYRQLSLFLNQNPLNHAKDYELLQNRETEVSEHSPKRFYLHKNRWHKSFSVFIFFSYVSVVLFLILKRYFLETFSNFVIFSIPCVILSYFLFKKQYLDSKRLSQGKYLLFCFTAISPVMVVSLMLLNLLVPASSTKKFKFKTQGHSIESTFSINQNDFSILDKKQDVFFLENNYTVPIELRKVDQVASPVEIEYTYHYGIMGLKVFDGRQEKAIE